MVAATPIADMITEMLKNCIPLEMIISAVRSMERAVSTRHGVDETAEKRRAWDREYRRNKRSGTSDHPPDPPDNHPKPPDVGNRALSSSIQEEGLSMKEGKKERARGKKLPPDWKPNEQHYAEGARRGMSRSAVDELANEMRDWSAANENRAITTKANWDIAFMRTWIKQRKYVNGTAQVRSDKSLTDNIRRELAELEGSEGADLALSARPVLLISR
jgi:hypothetical protein